MAVLVAAGFERGTHLGLATGNANNKYMDRTQGTLGTNVEIVSAAARTGSYGLRLTASAATVFCGFANNAQGGVLGTAAVIVQSFWFRIPSLPGANAIVWSSFGTVGGGDMALRFVQATGTLNAEVGASTVTGPSVSANTWYHIDLKADYGVNPHTLDWQFNGAAQTQVTATQAAEQIFISGWGLDNAAQTITFHVDDTLMSITAADYPFGKHKVVQLIPDTAGSTAEIGTANATVRFTGNATADGTHNSSDILTAISEVPPLISSSSTGVCQVTAGTGNAVGIPMTTYTLAGGETVSGLRVVVTGWAQSTTAASIGLRTFNGTTETTLFSSADPNFDASTTAPAGLCKMATLANFDTQTELDALVVRLGYSADVSPIIGAHAIYAELAVKESTGSTGTAAITEAGDTSSASGQLGYSGTFGTTEAADTSSASGTVVNPVTGTAAVTQAGQTSSASGTLGYSGTSAVTQAANVSAASGQLGYSGSLAQTQANETATASGKLGYSGTTAAAQAAETSSASGTFTPTGVSGTAAVTQAAQTAAASGQLGYSGSASPAQASQTSTASGQLGYTGTSATAQAAQTSTASGTYTSAGSFTGSAAVTQADQTSSASGKLGYSGTTAATQASQTSTAAGTVINPITGTSATTQATQFSVANGVLRYTGTGTSTEAADTSSAAGVASGPIAGSAAPTQANQTANAAGVFMPLVSLGTAHVATGHAAVAVAVPVATSSVGGASFAPPSSSAGSMPVPTASGG